MLSIDINLLWTVINILVLCWLVKKFLIKPVHKILDERQQLIDKNLKDAEDARTEAANLVTEHQEQLKGIEQERNQTMMETTQKATETYDQIVASANEKADAIIENAQKEGERQRQAILRQTERDVQNIVMDATAKVAGKQSSDDSKLYDEFLEKVGNADDESNA